MNIELRAGDEVRVWIDGEDVTIRSFVASVPAQEGAEGPGWVDMYTTWPPTADPNGNPVTEHRNGIVKWEPAE